MRSIEQNNLIDYSERVTSTTGRTRLFLQNHLFGPIERHSLRNILVGTNDEYAENFGDDYLRAIEDGYSPILIGNHRSHVDGVLLSKVAKVLTMAANDKLPEGRKMQGLALIMAASLHYGYQGVMLKGLLDDAYSIIDGNDTLPFYNVRPQDYRRYKMIPDYAQERTDLVNAISNGWGVAILPEGQTKAGKTKKETGQTYGMIPFMNGAIPAIMTATYEAGKIPLLIPVSIAGGSEIQSANTRLPSLAAFKAGIGMGDLHIADLFVSSPIRANLDLINEYFETKNHRMLNDTIGRIVASHLPEKDRGVYA